MLVRTFSYCVFRDGIYSIYKKLLIFREINWGKKKITLSVFKLNFNQRHLKLSLIRLTERVINAGTFYS